MMTSQRSILLFNHAMSSEETKKSYLNEVKRFRTFYKIRDYDSLITIDPKKLQIMVEDYTMTRKGQVEVSSLRSTLSALELFFSMNDVVLNFKKTKKLVPRQETKQSGMKAYTVDEVSDLIEACDMFVHKAIIYVLASSGVRVGFIDNFKMKHLKDMPLNCKAMTVYADTYAEYVTFITPEASEKLEQMFDMRRKKGEKLTPESFVFMTNKRKCFTQGGLSTLLNRKVKESKIIRTKTHRNRYDIMSAHGIRKFFDTALKLRKDLNPNVVERLLSHKSKTIGLDSSYFRPTENDLFEVYKKAIPYLTIDKSSRLRFELNENKERLARLEDSKDRRIIEMENDMRLFKEFVKSMKKESS